MIIGIDMGTTNSAVAVADAGGVATVIVGSDGLTTLRSSVYYDGNHLQVGHPGPQISASNQFFGIKRLLGRKAHSDEIERLARAVPFEIAASPVGDCWVRIDGTPTPPQKLAGAVLRHIRLRAQDHVGEPVTRAVLAVPAYFDDAQRQAVRDAGQIAGLDIVRLINEPTAAALAYGVTHRDEPTTVAVFDLGGGTFDVSILHVANDVFTVLASHGDASLGGDDWDRQILEWLVDEIFAAHQFDATSSPEALATLREVAEQAKIDLSTGDVANLRFSLTTPINSLKTIEFSKVLTREQFEAMSAELCKRLAEPCNRALVDAGLSPADLDTVLLVGGMTRAPMVKAAVAHLLGENIADSAIDPSTAVAQGAAICASVLDGSDTPMTLLDVTSHSLGIRVGDFDLPAVIERGEELPARKKLRFEIPAGVDFSDGLTVELFRGEAEELSENIMVGRVLLELGESDDESRRIELTLMIDVNSIVSVHALDLGNGQVAESRLRTRGALSQSQLVRIVESSVIAAITGSVGNGGEFKV